MHTGAPGLRRRVSCQKEGRLMAGYRWRGTAIDVAPEDPATPRLKPVKVYGDSALTRCGTANGYKRHGKRGEQACTPCKAAQAQYSREYRARVRVGEVILRKPFSAERCGTYAGFRRHTKHSVPLCAPCRKAHQEYQSAYRAKRRAEITVTYKPESVYGNAYKSSKIGSAGQKKNGPGSATNTVVRGLTTS